MDYLTPTATMRFKMLLSLLTAPVLAFYTPVSGLLGSILWLVLIDIITGMYVARFIEGKPICSRSFFRKLPQLLFFFVAITAALHADSFFTEFGLPQYQSAKWTIAFYGIYELFSILENLGKSGLPIAKQIHRILQNKLPDDIKQGMEQVKKEETKQ